MTKAGAGDRGRFLTEGAQRGWLIGLGQGSTSSDELFELETLLKALERFCNPANHPARSSGPVTLQDSLKVEMVIFERQLRRIRTLCQHLIDEAQASALIFQSYVESQWVSDDERDRLLRSHVDQATPLESLFSMLGALSSLTELAASLRRLDRVRLSTFRAIGDQYRLVIVQNRFFNPLARNPFDRVWHWREHPVIRQALREAPTEGLRRAIAFLILVVARYLKILSWIHPQQQDREQLLEAIPLYALIHSELKSLRSYLETTLGHRFFAEGTSHPAEREFLVRADSMAFQLSLDVKTAFHRMLLDYQEARKLSELRGRIEAAHGLLGEALEGAVISILNVVRPELETRDIFPDSAIRLAHSVRLREDLWIFSRVLAHVATQVADVRVEALVKKRIYKGLLEFLNYFESLSFQLVRWTEHDSFQSFFSELRFLRDGPFSDPVACQDIAANFECFQIFVDTVSSQVARRACLQGVAFDEGSVRKNLTQFLRGGAASRP